MKRLLKSILFILAIIIMAISITGCGKKKEGNREQEVDISKSKTYKAFEKMFSGEEYLMSIEEEINTEKSVNTIAKKGDKVYVKTKTNDEETGIIYKDNKTYVISHNEKMYIVSEQKVTESMDEIITEEDMKEIENGTYTTGKETIDGVKYDYEEYVGEDGVTSKYYFDGNDLKYVKTFDDGNISVIKILELSSNVDDSLFEIPANYEELNMDSIIE